MSTAANQ